MDDSYIVRGKSFGTLDGSTRISLDMFIPSKLENLLNPVYEATLFGNVSGKEVLLGKVFVDDEVLKLWDQQVVEI